MKKLLIALMIIVFVSVPIVSAKTVTLRLEWSPNTEPDLKQYVVYHKIDGQAYDYNISAGVVAAPATTIDLHFDVADGELVSNKFIVRAEDINDNESGDSNEVVAIIDLRIPTTPVAVVGVFNNITETIDFTWGQADQELVQRWQLFQSTVSGGPFTQIGGDILNDGSTHSTSWNAPSDGDYYFVLVAYRDGSDILDTNNSLLTSIEPGFSANSNEVVATVVIPPSDVKMFQIKVRVYQE